MSLLDRFEEHLDNLLNGALTAAFDSEVQPVELVAAITREMDEHVVVSANGRVVAPNHFLVELADHDFDRLGEFFETLIPEFCAVAASHAKKQQYTLTGDIAITIERDLELESGVYRVAYESVAQSSSALVVDIANHTLTINGAVHQLTRPVTRLGRSADADLKINDPIISRIHAEITMGSVIILRDLDSTNGTWVNSKRIQEHQLAVGDSFKLGTVEVVFQ